MKFTKIFLALAIFMTCLTFDQQVMMTREGLVSSWSVSISHSQALAQRTLEAISAAGTETYH
jgi:hypothetical protein